MWYILCYIYILYDYIYVCEYIYNSCKIHSTSICIHRSCKCFRLMEHLQIGWAPRQLTVVSSYLLATEHPPGARCRPGHVSKMVCLRYKPKAIPSIPSSGLSWYIMIYHDISWSWARNPCSHVNLSQMAINWSIPGYPTATWVMNPCHPLSHPIVVAG
jgi:hypothetical protein